LTCRGSRAGCDDRHFARDYSWHDLFVDDSLTLLTDTGKTEAIVIDVLDNPATEEGLLLKVMTRGPFEQGQQVWILDRDGSKIGATVEDVVQQTVDREVTLSTALPA
jgi:hypothetical protein